MCIYVFPNIHYSAYVLCMLHECISVDFQEFIIELDSCTNLNVLFLYAFRCSKYRFSVFLYGLYNIFCWLCILFCRVHCIMYHPYGMSFLVFVTEYYFCLFCILFSIFIFKQTLNNEPLMMLFA